MSKIKEVFSSEQIKSRIAALGSQISADYKERDWPVVIGVLKGSFCFLAELVSNIKLPHSLQIEFVHLSSYGAGKQTSGTVQAPYLNLPNITGRHVLIVEDIVDSGLTAQFLLEYLKDQFKPASLKLAAFLDKPANRQVPVKPDYVGFTVGDTFIVGYGFDYAERYRELPYIGELVEK